MRATKFVLKVLLFFAIVAAVSLTLTCLGGPGSTSQNTLSGGITILSPENARTAGDSIYIRFQSDQYSQIDSFTVIFGDSSTKTLFQHDLGDSGAAWISHVYSTPGRYNISALISSAGTGATATRSMEIAVRTRPPVVDSIVSGNTECTIVWKAVAGAVSYNVFYTAGPTTDKTTGLKISGVTSPCIVDSLTNDTQYSFAVSAVSAGGESGLSTVFSAIPIVRKQFVLTTNSMNGTVTRSPERTKYDSGTVVNLTPVPAAGYRFTGWSGDLTGTANPGSIAMAGTKTVTANFAVSTNATFTLTVSATNGTVTRSPSLASYDSGTVVTLTPVPAAGYVFTSWSGDLTGTANPGTITITSAKTITANFTKIATGTFALTVSGTNGTVTRSPSLASYDSGTVVTLTPVPAAGYLFTGWSGDLTGTANPGTITMTGTKTVTANFAIKTYTLTVSGTHGTVTSSPSQSAYDSGTVVILTPVPAAGYMFSGWSGDLTGTANPGAITMASAKTVTANFAKIAVGTFPLTVSGTNGTVTRSPSLASYDSGTVVTLTPVPAAGYVFTGWSGDLTGTANPGSITMTGTKTVTANFVIKVSGTFSLTTSGTNGIVTRSPNLTAYDSGTVVMLTPVPSAGYVFIGWSGDLGGTANPASITMTAPKTAIANFAKKTFSLAVSGTNGMVTLFPSQSSYDSGTVVTLTPVPAAGYLFTGWTGDLTGAGNPDSITMSGPKNITANFTKIAYTLTVSGANGTVTCSPSQSSYDPGTVVTMTAVPAAGHKFINWSGDISGSTSPSSVIMNGNKTVGAVFSPLPFTITFDKNDVDANGTIDQQTINFGSSANLTPNGYKKPGWSFAGWATSSTGSVAYANKASYTMGPADVVLFAKWTRQMVKIMSAGKSFQMGQSGVSVPVHQVTFSNNFWMDTTEVTQADFIALMGYNGSFHSGGNLPEDKVTWFDAVLYCNNRSKRDGLDTVYSYTSKVFHAIVFVSDLPGLAIDYSKNGYRLPTEAEWEYACRGGTTTFYWWGSDTNGMNNRTWSVANSDLTTHQVATKQGNAYGVYDMTGNVWEWCNDWFVTYDGIPVTDPTGPPAPIASLVERVVRGASYVDSDINFYSASRGAYAPSIIHYEVGFRCVLPAP